MESLSKTKIDRLGDRLRKGNLTDDDLRLLDEYRRSFAAAYDEVVGVIRNTLKLEPTGRPAKSTTSIVEKLRRESIRLTQMQDIAGCRLIVPAIADQEQVVASLVEALPHNTVVDRREKPSHGYRAVHVVAPVDNRLVEIQVRTALQQLWAELSEKLADLIDPAIKYGGGTEQVEQLLTTASEGVAEHEARESKVLKMQRTVKHMLQSTGLTEELRASIISHQEQIATLQTDLGAYREKGVSLLRETVQTVDKIFGTK
jgi:ppGpp synthetase/RelA/SpoT-type nucleotidyltranferase